jgi:ribosomal-protein-alanine N-acetyltransferase
MILQTQHLTLRPMQPSDARAMHRMMADPEVMAFWDVGEIEDFDLVVAILNGQIQDVMAGKAEYWAMVRTADQAFVGCCDISDIDLWHRRAEIGFITAKSFWGGGYAFEAMGSAIAYALEGLRLRRLSARVHVGNDRSVRLLERLGFTAEGVLRGYVVRGNDRRDCQIFGLTA